MNILLYFLLFLLLILVWILLVKINVEIDSNRDLYVIHIGNVIHANLAWNENIILIHFKVLVFRFTKKFNLFSKRKPPAKKKKPSKISRFKLNNPMQKLRKAIKSFKVHYCSILIDTDDYYINSLFYPVAFLISQSPIKLQMNYQGINSIQLSISNRPIKIITAIFL